MLYFFLEVNMENQPNIGDQNVQPVGQNPVAQPTVIDKPKTNFTAIFATGLICSLVFGAGGYFLGKQSLQSQKYVNEGQNQNHSSTSASQVDNSVPTTNPSSISDQTANWKTYTNEKYGFNFKYPGEWVVEFNEKDSGFEEKNLKVSSGPYSIKFDWTSAGYGGVICKFNDTTSDEFAGPGTDKLYKPYSLGTFLGKDSRRNLDPILQLDQYGYQRNELGYTFRVCTKMDGLRSDGKSAYEGAISTKLGTLEITYETPRSNINKDSLSTTDQILSTFNFTN